MLAREHLSAIVVTSSVSSLNPTAGSMIYSATKSFASYMIQGLSYEVEGKIDCLDWCPGEVDTKLLNSFKPADWMTRSCSTAVKSALRDLGSERRTYGCHDRPAWMLSNMPMSLIQPMALKMSYGMWEK